MTEDQYFRLCGAVLFVLGVGTSMRYRYESESSGEKLAWREEGVWVMVWLRIFGLLLWLSLLLYFVYPSAIAWAQFDWPVSLRWVGVGIAALMVPCLLWTFRSIGKNITQTVGLREGHQLITHGAYRWVRHPLYTFGTLNFLAYAMIAANGLLFMWSALGFVMLMVRLPKEEARLIEEFGQDYLDYKKRTGALVPKFF